MSETIVSVERKMWLAFFTRVTASLPANSDLRDGQEFMKTLDGKNVATFVSGIPDGDIDSLERNIAAAKGKGVPVCGYWTLSMQAGRLPKGADWVGIEAYQKVNESLTGFETRLKTGIAKVISAGQLPALICQCYTSNATNTSDLVPLVPVYARLFRNYPIIAGLVFSGPSRPTGYQDHPEVHASWKTLFNSITGTPPLPAPPEPPMPTAKTTIASYDSTVTLPATCHLVARVTQGSPDSFRWQYQDGGEWRTSAERPASDLDHDMAFPRAGSFPVRIQTIDGGQVVDQSSSTSRVVTVKPAEVTPIPPQPPSDKPVYDSFVNVESPKVAATFAEVNNGTTPAPGNMGHNSYRRLAQGWTADEVQQGIRNSALNFNRAPWFGWVPVEYDPYVGTASVVGESRECADAYRQRYGSTRPTAADMGHVAWRRFAEFWTHRDILHDIKGEPLEDGGHGGQKPPGPPVGIARTGVTRAQGRSFADDAGVFNPLGQTLFWTMRGWKFEQDRIKKNIDFIASKRYDYIRELAQVGWTGNSIDEDWPDHVQILGEVIDYAYSKGLRTQVTGVGGGDYSASKVIDNMIAAIRGREHKVIYVEVANEWYGNWDGSEEEMKAMGRKLKNNLPNLVALSAPKEEMCTDRTDPWVSGGYANMGTCHLDRSDNTTDWKWRHIRKPWEPRNPSYPVSHGEPGGPLSSVASFMEPIHLVMSRAVGILCGFEAYCLHNAAGVYGQVTSTSFGVRPANVWETPNIDHIMEVVRALDEILPANPSAGQATRKGLGAHPLTADLIWVDGGDHGVVRDYARRSGATFWQCLQGIKNYVNLTADRAYHLELIDPVTHEKREMSVGGGQTIRVDRGSVDTRGYGAWIVRGRNA